MIDVDKRFQRYAFEILITESNHFSEGGNRQLKKDVTFIVKEINFNYKHKYTVDHWDTNDNMGYSEYIELIKHVVVNHIEKNLKEKLIEQ